LAASSAIEQFSRDSAKVSRAQQRARMNARSDSVDVDVDVDEREWGVQSGGLAARISKRLVCCQVRYYFQGSA
jgi:hypothetical protein